MQVSAVGNETGSTVFAAQTLGKDDFLQLLVTQLRLQDPLEPIKEREFIAQPVSYTHLDVYKRQLVL